METSQKEGVSDPSANTYDLPKHEASQLNDDHFVSFQRSRTPYGPVRILALLPLRSPDPTPHITSLPSWLTSVDV